MYSNDKIAFPVRHIQSNNRVTHPKKQKNYFVDGLDFSCDLTFIFILNLSLKKKKKILT